MSRRRQVAVLRMGIEHKRCSGQHALPQFLEVGVLLLPPHRLPDGLGVGQLAADPLGLRLRRLRESRALLAGSRAAHVPRMSLAQTQRRV